jgi:hypothetical protein
MKRVLILMALVGLMTTLALAGAEKGSWTGNISDAKCGAKFNADCAKKCVEAGQQMVFVNDKDGSVLPIANQDALKGHAGHHVKIEGSVENNTLTVSSVSMVDDKK